MLGQMQRRMVAYLAMKEDEDPDGPGGEDPGGENPPGTTYPAGRLNAVRVNGAASYIFYRTDGTRRASGFTPPLGGGGNLAPEPGRVNERTWFLYTGGNRSYFTADYASEAMNIRVPTPQENPSGSFRRVYNRRIDSYVVEVVNGAIVAKTLTGTQDVLFGTTGTTPSPFDPGVRQSSSGYKLVNLIAVNGTTHQGQAIATGGVTGVAATYPPVTLTQNVGAFTVSVTSRESGCGDTVLVSGQNQTNLIVNGCGTFNDLGRPISEAEGPVASEKVF